MFPSWKGTRQNSGVLIKLTLRMIATTQQAFAKLRELVRIENHLQLAWIRSLLM